MRAAWARIFCTFRLGCFVLCLFPSVIAYFCIWFIYSPLPSALHVQCDPGQDAAVVTVAPPTTEADLVVLSRGGGGGGGGGGRRRRKEEEGEGGRDRGKSYNHHTDGGE